MPDLSDAIRRIEAIERRLTPPRTPTSAVSFGSRLRDLRFNKGLSQTELINKVGISKGYLSDLENDKRTPGADVLYKLARELGVSMDYLWTGK
jgi:ribosome-binding protein aMBF1 (putative translation factor)